MLEILDSALPSQEDDRDLLTTIPAVVMRFHMFPWLDKDDWRSLRLVNKHFSGIYRSTVQSLYIRICREALYALSARHDSPYSSAADDATLREEGALGLRLRYPSVSQVSLCCGSGPLTPLMRSNGIVQLVELLGRRPTQTQITLLDAHLHPLLGSGTAAAPLCRGHSPECSGSHGDGSNDDACDCAVDGRCGGRGGGDGSDGGPDEGPLAAAAAVADALAGILPCLQEISFTRKRTPLQPQAAPNGSSNHSGRGGRSGRNYYSSSSSRVVLAPQLLLQRLAAALLHPTECHGHSVAPDQRPVGHVGLSAATATATATATAAVHTGLQAFRIDYSQPSVDPFEAELLDPHVTSLPLLLLDVRGLGARANGGGGGPAVTAAALHPILRHPTMQRPSYAAAGAPAPLLRLTSLELRGVAVLPGLLTGLRELSALTRLVLSVSCTRPYEPLVTSLPYMTRLAHLHLFLHVPAAAAARRLTDDAAAAVRRYGSGGGGAGGGRRQFGGGGGGAEDLDSPDCTAIHLASAVSQCRCLVSLGLPGEDVGGQMPAVLRALPGLTQLSARQLGPWQLSAPHTGLRSVTLTMTWPAYLAQLLPGLPRLEALTADMYLHADADASGSGGSGAEELYDELSEVASGLCGVRHVELQLSVMRREGWKWGRAVQALGARLGVRLRGLTLRMPQPDSGPQLRAQDFAAICRRLQGLRRLTLLLGHPSASKLNAKALQALRELPYLEKAQLHLGGVWEGRRAAAGEAGASGDGGGGRGGSGGGKAGCSSHCSRFRLGAGTQQGEGQDGRSNRRSGRDRGGCRHDKRNGGKREGARLVGAGSGVVCGGIGSGSGSGEARGRTAATDMPAPPPPPSSAAALAVLAAARGLGHRGGVAAGEDISDVSSSAEEGDGEEDCDDEECGGGAAAAAGGSDGGNGEGDAVAGGREGHVGRCGAFNGSRPGEETSMSLAAHAPPPPPPPRQVQLQVDFLTAREAAAVNAVLRWEGRPAAVVVAGLRPRWEWAELGGR